MRKTGFIYPGIFLLFLDFLFLMRSCKASNLDSERHFIECFHSRGQHLCRFIGTKESVCIRKEFNSQRIGWDTNMAAFSLFWDTNMAAVTSCENTLLSSSVKDDISRYLNFFAAK